MQLQTQDFRLCLREIDDQPQPIILQMEWMILLRMLSWYVIIVVLPFVQSKKVEICASELMSSSKLSQYTPTLEQSLAAAFNSGGMVFSEAFAHLSSQYYHLVPYETVFNYNLPFALWFMDSGYQIDLSALPNDAKISLFQEDTRSALNPFCWMGISFMCTCAIDDPSPSILQLFDGIAPCRTKVSYSSHRKSRKQAPLNVPIDPTRQSCILIETESQQLDELSQIVSFSLTIPDALEYISKRNLERLVPHPMVANVLQMILSHIPFYLCNLLLGLFAALWAVDLADYGAVRLVLKAILGVLIALVVLGFMAHRVIDQMLSRSQLYSTRLVDWTVGAAFISMSLGYSKILALLRDLLFDFWEHGAFGVPHFGKIYFAVMIVLAWSISHWFGLFEPDTRSFSAMVGGVRCTALLLLMNSSSSHAVALCFILFAAVLVLLAEPLHDLSFLIYATITSTNNGFQANRIKRGAPTKTQIQATVNRKTAEELRKLQNHLKNSPAALNRFVQAMREDNKDTTGNLMQQFAAGIYSGRPTQVRSDGSRRRRLSWTSLLVAIVILVSALFVAGLLADPSDDLRLMTYVPSSLRTVAMQMRQMAIGAD